MNNVRIGLRDVVLRYISPYGFAVRTAAKIGYETDQYLEFYRRGLAHVIRLNKEGVSIRESSTAMILRRMLTPYADGYVDLQSPAGMGLMGIAYNYNGEVYSSDEGRMLAEMGDYTFRLGNLHQNTYEEMIVGSNLLEILHATMAEATPQCSDCALLPWCGVDPVFHHRTQGDLMGHRPSSAFCRRNMEQMKHILCLLEDEPEAERILRGWL